MERKMGRLHDEYKSADNQHRDMRTRIESGLDFVQDNLKKISHEVKIMDSRVKEIENLIQKGSGGKS